MSWCSVRRDKIEYYRSVVILADAKEQKIAMLMKSVTCYVEASKDF
jgi:hypothetical protein